MKNSLKIAVAISAACIGTAAFADPQEDSATASGDSHCNLLPGACDAPPDDTHCGLLPGACGPASPAHWGLGPLPGQWGWGPIDPLLSIFDPYLLDIPGGEGKGMPVYSASDPKKIIGYMKMPAPHKPKGPVHCMIKETGLLAKTVDDCEAAGGSVAK